ncbi:unnamed protein product [Brachionus calyciflorus]|uniref:Purine nucleoside phosphorylase n=1 Tax=Brachionus calyciflorus TaxID=104777 RepID=A0A813TH21_9BILA|nr:unnamed protein product [Brachionus calyciflorus]
MNSLEGKVSDAFLKEFNLPKEFISHEAIANAYYTYEKCESMAKLIKDRVNFDPKIAIICGSGLGDIGNLVENAVSIPYTEIPEFPRSTVLGHLGNLIFGNLSGLPVVCMQGRFHPFEGYSMSLCTLPIKIFKLLGCKMVILTNAAGGLNRVLNVGDVMLIKDHMSFPLLSLKNPLIGVNDERFGPRFVPINKLYTKSLRELFKVCSHELNIPIHEGVYGTIGGPSYETIADSRFCLTAGMDCVGMSTSHEAIVAAYCGLKVLACSIITDKAPTDYEDEEPDHKEIVKVAAAKAKDIEKLICCFLSKIKEDLSLIE